MINRNLGQSEMLKTLYESDKAFDESMATLINWLETAIGKEYLSSEKALEIFKEELKNRRTHEV